MRFALMTGVAAVAGVLFAATAIAEMEVAKPADPDVTWGKAYFMWHCATCHGRDGKGAGPMAKVLNIVLTDLTTLRRRHEGEFPWDYIYDVVDGREWVEAHGSRDMPVWGDLFEPSHRHFEHEQAVRARVLELILYLRSIQED